MFGDLGGLDTKWVIHDRRKDTLSWPRVGSPAITPSSSRASRGAVHLSDSIVRLKFPPP